MHLPLPVMSLIQQTIFNILKVIDSILYYASKSLVRDNDMVYIKQVVLNDV